MENMREIKKPSITTAALSYGLLTAIALIVLTLIIYMLDLTGVSWISYLAYAFLLVGIILGTIKYREDSEGGFLSYGRALGYGTLVSVFAALISGIFMYVFYQFLAPDAMDQVRVVAAESIIEANPDISDQDLDMMLRFTSPLLLFLGSLFSISFLGFIFSLVTAAFLKKNDPEQL